MAKQQSGGSSNAEAMKAMAKAMAAGGNRKGNAAQAAAMQMLMAQMFGDSGQPTLADVLAGAGKAIFVSPKDSVRGEPLDFAVLLLIGFNCFRHSDVLPVAFIAHLI